MSLLRLFGNSCHFTFCVVGHVEDRGKWGLVDRSGPLAHTVFAEADQ